MKANKNFTMRITQMEQALINNIREKTTENKIQISCLLWDEQKKNNKILKEEKSYMTIPELKARQDYEEVLSRIRLLLLENTDFEEI